MAAEVSTERSPPSIIALLVLFTAGQSAVGQQAAGPRPPVERRRPGLWIADTAFSPADIASATQQWNSYFGGPNVLVTFTETGRAKFERVQQGRLEEVLEISIDGVVASSPVLREIITGNQVAISGG